MRVDKRILKSLSLLLPMTGMLALYAYIATFSRLTGDDYCLLYFADRFGLLRSIWYWYLNFHGVFSGVTVDYFLTFFGEKWMGVVLPACLLVWVGMAAFSFAAMLDQRYRGFRKTLAACALGSGLVVAVLVWSPNIQQSYYWWAGTRKYVMPLIFISLYPGLYLKFLQKDRRKSEALVWYLVSFGLLFFVGGFSETLNPGLIVAYIFAMSLRLWLTKFNLKDKKFLFLLAGFAGLAIAFTIMALAPGNSVRQEYFAEPPGLLSTLKIATLSYIEFLSFIPKSWILSFVFLGSAFAAVGLGMERVDTEAPKGWSVVIYALIAFVIPWACFVPFAYIASEPLVPRAMINPAFLFTATFLYAGLLFGKWLAARTRWGERAINWGSLAALTLVLLSVSLWNAGRDFYSLSQAHIKYAHEWDKVQTQIIRAVEEGKESLSVPPRNNWAGILELSDNPKSYVNQCISRYYGVDIKTDDSLRVPE